MLKKSGRSPTTSLDWSFSQVFGEKSPGGEPVQDGDIISAVEFEKKGDYLALGDNGGRVVLFEKEDLKVPCARKESEKLDRSAAVYLKYVYKTEFQSHEPEFDYLKSLEIEEKINQLRWCNTLNNSLFLLSTNSKTIKLWKVVEQKVKKDCELSSSSISSENTILSGGGLMSGKNEHVVRNGYRLEWVNKKPRHSLEESSAEQPVSYTEEATSRCRRVYGHAHEYNINSISVNSDAETFLSSDDLRINLWHLEIRNQCFNIVDMKPPSMEDLTEVITVTEFHPIYCNILAYGSSRGYIRLVDMRRSALCDQSARILQSREAHASRSIFTEIVSSISDVKFASDGFHMLCRDYMNLKLWDLRNEKHHVASFKVHEHLRPKLSELYNHDAVFDKFKCCISGDGLHFATGSYSNLFRIFSRDAGNEDGSTLETSKNPYRARFSHGSQKPSRLLTPFVRGHNRQGQQNLSSDGSDGIPSDLTNKVTHLSWHPTENFIACASTNSLYMYYS